MTDMLTFTDTEQATIDTYQDRIQGLPECFELTPESFSWHEKEFGRDSVIEWVKGLFEMLTEWHMALDAVHADLTTGYTLSPAAGHYIRREANEFMHTLNLTRREVLRWLLGTAGPTPAMDSGAMVLSNFPLVELDGTAVAEGGWQ